MTRIVLVGVVLLAAGCMNKLTKNGREPVGVQFNEAYRADNPRPPGGSAAEVTPRKTPRGLDQLAATQPFNKTLVSKAVPTRAIYPDPVILNLKRGGHVAIVFAPEQSEGSGAKGTPRLNTRISAVCVDVRPVADGAKPYTAWCYPFQRIVSDPFSMPQKPVVAQRDQDRLAVAFVDGRNLTFHELDFRQQRANVEVEMHRFRERLLKHREGVFQVELLPDEIRHGKEVPSKRESGYAQFPLDTVLRPRVQSVNAISDGTLEELRWQPQGWVASVRVQTWKGDRLARILIRKRPKSWTAKTISVETVRTND